MSCEAFSSTTFWCPVDWCFWEANATLKSFNFQRIVQCSKTLTDVVPKVSKLYARMVTLSGNKAGVLC